MKKTYQSENEGKRVDITKNQANKPEQEREKKERKKETCTGIKTHWQLRGAGQGEGRGRGNRKKKEKEEENTEKPIAVFQTKMKETHSFSKEINI